jgi:hypothetical protein
MSRPGYSPPSSSLHSEEDPYGRLRPSGLPRGDLEVQGYLGGLTPCTGSVLSKLNPETCVVKRAYADLTLGNTIT